MNPTRYATPPQASLSLGFINAQVVGHEPRRRQRVRDLLGEIGFDIEVVSTASDGIPLIAAQPPSLLVICDDLEAKPDALGLLKWLSNQDYGDSVHTLVLCDTKDQDRCERLLRHGACDLLSIHFDQGELRERFQIAEYRSEYLRTRLAESHKLKLEATQYREIVQHWPQAAILTPNLSRPIKEVNQRALEILGLSHEDVVGKYLSLVLPDLFERDDFVPYEDFSKHPSRIENVPHETPFGVVMLEIRVVGMEWGKEGAVLVTFENMGRMQAMERHRSRISQVESVRRFASEMAHEFNNILTVVNGNLALLQGDKSVQEPQAKQLISSSQNACRRATELVKRLTKQKDFGQTNVAFLDTDAVVRAATSSAVLSPRATVNITTSESLWPVHADEKLLTEGLMALIKNADEALANSVIEVDVENMSLGEDTSLPLEPGDYIRIQVLDQGPGMPSQIDERAFEPFFTTRPEAEGLGLTFTLKIAEDLGGTLQIEPSPTGKGACLVWHLPADRDAKQTEITPEAPNPIKLKATLVDGEEGILPSVTETPVHIPRVLFLDDEPDIRTIVDKILSSHEFEVTCTSTGEEAIDAYYQAIADNAPYDVLLLDLEVVGGMGGKDTIAILRKDFPNIKAVVTTGYLDDAVLSNHREHGFSGVLTKPFQMEDLVSVLRVLGGPTG